MLKRTLLLVVACTSFFVANAQLRLGPVVGANFNRQIHKSNSYRFQDIFASQLSYNVGVLGDVVLTPYLSIQPELIYTFKGGKYNLEESFVSEDYQAKLGYLSMPITLTGKMDIGRGYLFLGAGGYISKLMFTSHTLEQNGVDVSAGKLRVGNDLYGDQVKPWDVGVKVKAGFELKKGFYLAGFYDIGVTDINPQFSVVRNKTVGVQASFIFSLTEEDRYDRFENFYEF